MIKIKNLEFRIQKSWVVILSFLILNSALIIPELAQAATPSPSQDPAVTEFQQKVEQIKQEAASKAADLKNSVSQNIQNKAYIGTVTTTQDQQLTIQSAKITHSISVDQYTSYLDTGGKKSPALQNFKDLKKDDFISALGDVDDKGVMHAKKIIRSKPPTLSEKSATWGQIQSTLVNRLVVMRNDNQKVTFNTDSNTSFGFGNQEIKFTDLKIGNFIIALGSKLDQNNISNAQFIYLLNPKGDLKLASPSASATPSASPKRK
jgi:hypothetical protein